MDGGLREFFTEFIDGHQDAFGEILKLLNGEALSWFFRKEFIEVYPVEAEQLFLDLLQAANTASTRPFFIRDRDDLGHTLNVAPYLLEDKG